MKKVHNATVYRLDAKEITALLGVTIRTLSKMLKVNESALRMRPDSTTIQTQLQKVALVYHTLGEMLPAETIPDWLHHPIRSIGGITAIQLAEEQGIDSLQALVDEMFAGSFS